MAKFCTSCGKERTAGIRFCTACGTSVPAQEQSSASVAETAPSVPVCRNCGAPMKDGTAFCTTCGAPGEGRSVPAPTAGRASEQEQQMGLPYVPAQPASTMQQGDGKPFPNREQTGKRKKRRYLGLTITGACLIAAAVLVILLVCGKKQPESQTSGPADPSDLSALSTVEAFDVMIQSLDGYYLQAETHYYAGFTFQADWYYSYAAATAAAIRTCLDANILAKGGTVPEDTKARLSNWEEIGRLNLACPFVWVYESLTYRAQGKEAEANEAWKSAQQHFAFQDASLPDDVLKKESLNDLIAVRTKIAAFEDKLYGVFIPRPIDYQRDPKGWDDGYLCTLGAAALKADETDYTGAMRHYKAALAADPFDGGNFAACALMSMYEKDIDSMLTYVSEGLKIAPEHKGLNELANQMAEAAANTKKEGGGS